MSVINKDYLDLQKEILKKQLLWKKEISDAIRFVELAQKNDNMPLIQQFDLQVSIPYYKNWILELMDLLNEREPALKDEMDQIKRLLNHETLERWVKEVLAFNEYYFIKLAETEKVSEWIPQLLAEHGIRPYLRRIAEVYAEEITTIKPMGTCPCCGEPVRLARLEGKVGKKVMYCPRCYASWSEKRTKCSHCGVDHDEKMIYFHLENDQAKLLYVCDDCKGYVKVMDEKQAFKKEEPALLDLNTIYLDILAQEKGYGVTIEKERVN